MLKRALDILISIIALVLFAPLVAIIAIAVRMKLGRPILFTQIRPGLRGEPFRMVKFRTMVDAHNSAGDLLPDSERLPPFGKWLRATSLDELPGLWNVLKGDMSLVGPRPLLMQYIELYSPEQARRQLVKPGITGWAQINGRNALSWDEKFKLDIWYVDNSSIWLDFKVLALTLVKVIKRDGISADGEATMPYFKGSNNT